MAVVTKLLWLDSTAALPRSIVSGDTVTAPGDWTFTGPGTAFQGDVSISGDLVVSGSIISSGSTSVVSTDNFVDLNVGYVDPVVNASGGIDVTNRAVSGTITLASTYSFTFLAGSAGVSDAAFSIGKPTAPYPTGSATFSPGDIIEFGSIGDGLDENAGIFVVDSVNDGTDAAGNPSLFQTQIIVHGLASGSLPTNAPFAHNQFTSGTANTGTVCRIDLSVLLASGGQVTRSTNPLDTIPVGTFATGYASSAWVSDPLGSSPPPVGRTELFFTPLDPADDSWDINGNAGTNPLTNFLGTSDAVDLVLRANNTERLRALSSGGIEILDGPFTLSNTGTAAQFRLNEPGGSNYTGFQAPVLAADVMYTLPTSDGTSGQALTTDGAGQLSWSNVELPTITVVAGEALNAGEVVYIDSTGSARKAETSSAINPARFYTAGVVKSSVVALNPVQIYANVMTKVPVRSSATLVAADNGSPVFLNSAVPGEITLSLPPAGNAVVRVGILVGADGVTTTPDVLLQLQLVSVLM